MWLQLMKQKNEQHCSKSQIDLARGNMQQKECGDCFIKMFRLAFRRNAKSVIWSLDMI